MSISGTRLAYLFNRYYEKTASRQETEELMQFLREARDDEQLSALLRQAWENLPEQNPLFTSQKSEEILHKILQAGSPSGGRSENIPVRTLFNWKNWAAAAAIVLAVGAAQYLWLDRTDHGPHTATTRLTHDIPPGGDKAILTLGDGSTVILDSAINGRLATQGATGIDKTGDGQLEYQPATDSLAAGQATVYNVLSTPKGGQYQVVLQDGSQVWLNSASSIRFPAAFTGKERKVELTGEAFFEVSGSSRLPFKVVSNGIEVEVLGTVFNVMAYSDEASIKTTLLEGRVRVTTWGNPKPETQNTKLLKPGQQAEVAQPGPGNREIRVVSGINTEEAIAWKNGLFQFKDASIETVMRQAARWYDIEVSYEGKIPERQFTGKVPRNVHISELLDMLKYAGVNFRIEERRVVVMP